MSEDHTAEREAFEAWYSAEDQETDDPERAYELTEEGMNELTKYCVWQGWQARAAAPVQPTQNGPEIDRLIDRLMSSDPDFDDCTKAAELIQREIKGPDGYATWRDAAIAERQRRVAAASAQSDTHPTTGEEMGTDAQEATAWKLAKENLERENAALREMLKKANSQAEHFEREWYLRGDALEALADTAPAPSKEYAELPKNRCVINTYMLSEDDARAFADATHALRTRGKP